MKRPLFLAIALATLTANAAFAAPRKSDPSPCAVPNN